MKGITAGFVTVLVVILLLAATGKFAGREQDEVECTQQEWQAWAPECNRWTPPPKAG